MTTEGADAYPFRLIEEAFASRDEVVEKLNRRAFLKISVTFQDEAEFYQPSTELQTAIDAAVAVGSPLLLTGEPGTGKTQVAYYISYKLHLEKVLHFQVKSDSRARELLYEFDAIRYLHDAHASEVNTNRHGSEIGRRKALNKRLYVEQREFWVALTSDFPRVLLIDEIDKAPRDFPNDLLFELDRMQFFVQETGQLVVGRPMARPILVVTSNSERQLPDAFLRRCVYHHLEFSEDMLERAFFARRHQFPPLASGFLRLAIERFMTVRDLVQRKKPSTAEFLVWMRLLCLSGFINDEALSGGVGRMPFMGALVKDRDDMDIVAARSGSW